MEEDIDDLLDEVESKYCSEKAPKSGPAKPTNSSIKPSSSKATQYVPPPLGRVYYVLYNGFSRVDFEIVPM